MSVVTPEQHGAKAHTDGGWGRSDVPVQTRSDRFTSNDPAEYPEVTGRELEWKLTPVASIRPLLDEKLDGSAYAYASAQTDGLAVEWLPAGHASIGSAGAPEADEDALARKAGWNTEEN